MTGIYFHTEYAGYSTYRERCDQTTAFALSPQVAVFADFDRDNIAEHIWLTLDMSEQEEVGSIMKAFHDLFNILEDDTYSRELKCAVN